MQKYRKCSVSEYNDLFSLRTYNQLKFSQSDFFDLRKKIDEYLVDRGYIHYDFVSEEGDFTLAEIPNDGCFLELSFENESFEVNGLIEDLHKVLIKENSEWMICIWFINTYFITQQTVITYSS